MRVGNVNIGDEFVFKQFNIFRRFLNPECFPHTLFSLMLTGKDK